jgi:hypothetical protein
MKKPQKILNIYLDGYVDGANILKFSRVIQNSLKFQLKKEFIDSLEEDHILIERNNLVFEYLIGTGEFGCVYKGILFTHENGHEEVAIKTLRKCKFSLQIIFYFYFKE